MQKSMYSNEITKLATVQQARDRYKVSRGLLMKMAEDYHALVRLGRFVRIDIEKFDAGLEKAMN